MVITVNQIKKLYKLLPPLLARDIKERYAGSVFGILWTFLQPLLFILLYWLVFSQILKIRIRADTGEIPFIAFLLSGLLPWFVLQEGVVKGASSIIDKRHIIKKVIFPVELFPLSSVLSALIYHGFGIIIFLVVFFIWRGEVTILQISFFILLLCIQILLAGGLAFMFACLSVYLRDLIQVVTVAFQIIFYVSPILYPLSAVPEKFKTIILLNPVTPLAESYHNTILYNKYPNTGDMLYLLTFTVFILVAGIYLFRRFKKGFADVL
jgi:ABC-type polysaccharide/polyol phosphate export permease